MSFKDAYRAANNEIHGDKNILAGINNKPKKIIYFKPAVGMVAAAAVCAVTLFVYPYINQFSGNEKSPAKNDEVFLTSEQSEGLQVPTAEPTQPEPEMRKSAPRTIAESDSEQKTNRDISGKNEKQTSSDDKIQNAVGNSPYIQEETDIATAYYEAEGNAVYFDTATDEQADSADAVTEAAAPARGGSGNSVAGTECICTAVNGNQITVDAPQKGEIVLKTTDKTVIVNSLGEPVQDICVGTRMVVFFDENIDETPSAVKIIVWEELQ